MDREEKIRLAKEQREEEYKYAVEEFKIYLLEKQRIVVEYMKKVSLITEWIFLWIWDDTPYLERFEKIFRILPRYIREKVLKKMRGGGDDEDALYGNEGVF